MLEGRTVLAWAVAAASAGIGCGDGLSPSPAGSVAVTARIEVLGDPGGRAPFRLEVDGSASSCPHECFGWEWDFGDRARATGARAAHVYASPGVYSVALTVEDALSGQGSTSLEVIVDPPDLGEPPPSSDPPPPLPPPPEGPPPAPDECDGVVPPVGDAATYELASGPADCRRAITDGRGSWIGLGVGLKWTGYGFVPPSGEGDPVGGLNLPLQGNPPGIAPQPSGYHVTTAGSTAGTFQVRDERGAVLSEGGTVGSPWAIVADPSGGSAMHSWDLENPPADGSSFRGDRLELVGRDGKLRASVLLDRTPSSIVVSASGNVLVFSGRVARWFDRDARPLTEWFPVPVEPVEAWRPVPARLADGRIGVRSLERWLAVVADGRPDVSAPPEWLASRPVNVAVVRGGRANAFVSPPDACNSRIEIVAPSGTSCGTVSLPDAHACAHVDIGADGTVFAAPTRRSEGFDGACTWTWWSGLLR